MSTSQLERTRLSIGGNIKFLNEKRAEPIHAFDAELGRNGWTSLRALGD